MDILEFFAPLRRWWWLLILGTLVATLSSFVVLRRQPPVYQAQATVAVGRAIKSATLDYNEVYLGEQLANTYADIAKRRPVQKATMSALGLSWLPDYQVKTVPNTQLLEIVVTDTDPPRAQAVANELANQLVKQGPAGENTEVSQRQDFVKTQLDGLEIKIQDTQDELTTAQEALGSLLSAREIADGQAQIIALQNKLATLQANYAALLANTQEGASNTVSVIESADLPVWPVGPNIPRSLALVGALGLFIAILTAYVLHYLDDTIKSPTDVKSALGLSTLSAVPKVDTISEGNEIVALSGAQSSAAEAYRVLRTNLQFADVDRPIRLLQVTSPAPSEGKSTTAANLAVALAQAGRRVIIVDGDLHRPRIHRIFKVPNNMGLTTALLQDFPSPESLLQSTSVPGLRVLTSGPLPPNPAELLGAEKTRDFLARLTEYADVLVIDSPPVLIVSDAAVLASQSDGVVLVVQAGSTRRHDAQRAVEALRSVNGHLLGVILNRVPTRGSGYYYYHYYRNDYYTNSDDGDGSSGASGASRKPRSRRRTRSVNPASAPVNASNEPIS